MSELTESKRAYEFEEIKYTAEYLKQQYDFFKHMTTLNTGAILIIGAISQYVFGESKLKWLLVLPVLSLFISLLYSVKLMRQFITRALRNVWNWYHFYFEKHVKEEQKKFSDDVEKYNKRMTVCFGVGIALFIILAILSYFVGK